MQAVTHVCLIVAAGFSHSSHPSLIVAAGFSHNSHPSMRDAPGPGHSPGFGPPGGHAFPDQPTAAGTGRGFAIGRGRGMPGTTYPLRIKRPHCLSMTVLVVLLAALHTDLHIPSAVVSYQPCTPYIHISKMLLCMPGVAYY